MKKSIKAMRALALGAFVAVTVVIGCGEDTSLVGGTCRYPYVECNLECVDILGDENNCGACGHVCASGVVCSKGLCGFAVSEAGPEKDGASDALTDRSDAREDATVDGALDGTTEDGATSDGSANDGASNDGAAGDGASNDGALGDGAPSDASVDAGPICTPPLTRCGSVCKNLTNDGDNCGVCGRVCASNICVNGVCQGAASGDIVYIGHDYVSTPLKTSQARLLENAVLLAPKTPVRVLVYQRYAAAGSVTQAAAILADAQARTGRQIVLTPTSSDNAVKNVSTTTHEVVLVHDQVAAPAGALATLGASWSASLAAFTHVGGVVVVLDGATGTGQMPELATQAGLLTVSSHTKVAAGELLELIAPTDSVAGGVVTPFAMRVNTSRFVSEPNGGRVSWVVRHQASTEPNVIHKIAP